MQYEHFRLRGHVVNDPKYVVTFTHQKYSRSFGFDYITQEEFDDEVFYVARRISRSDILGDKLHEVFVIVKDNQNKLIYQNHANQIFKVKELLSIRGYDY